MRRCQSLRVGASFGAGAALVLDVAGQGEHALNGVCPSKVHPGRLELHQSRWTRSVSGPRVGIRALLEGALIRSAGGSRPSVGRSGRYFSRLKSTEIDRRKQRGAGEVVVLLHSDPRSFAMQLESPARQLPRSKLNANQQRREFELPDDSPMSALRPEANRVMAALHVAGPQTAEPSQMFPPFGSRPRSLPHDPGPGRSSRSCRNVIQPLRRRDVGCPRWDVGRNASWEQLTPHSDDSMTAAHQRRLCVHPVSFCAIDGRAQVEQAAAAASTAMPARAAVIRGGFAAGREVVGSAPASRRAADHCRWLPVHRGEVSSAAILRHRVLRVSSRRRLRSAPPASGEVSPMPKQWPECLRRCLCHSVAAR